MFERVKSFFGIQAATQLAPIAPIKVRPGSRAYPSYLKSTRTSDSALPRADRRLATTDVMSYRGGNTTRQIMRDFASASPDLSAAVFSYLRLAITKDYKAVARNLDGTPNPEATALLQQLLVRFNVLTEYSQGFSGVGSMQSNSESMARELMLYGSCAAELVLGKDRLPQRIQPLSTTNIDFIADDKILRPVQRLGGDEIDLDIPTFFYVALDQSLLEPYSESPLESSLRQVLISEDFLNDLWRVLKKSIHPRVKVTIDEEKFRKNLPGDALHDETKLQAYQANLLAEIETKLNTLAPEDAVVFFDTIGIELENNGNASLSDEYKTIQGIIDARLATGAKIMPALLGRANSSNIASTESMIFVKNAEALKAKLDELYSRMLTLAVRLFGHDVYVEFRYASIDLRPASELVAFRQTNQMMILEQLSLGLITDEEACLELTGHLPPKGFTPLSGTRFKDAAKAAPAEGYNGESNDGSTLNQNLKPKTPDTGRGQNNEDKGATDKKPEDKKAEIVTPHITLNVDVDAKRENQAEVITMKRDEDGQLVVERRRAG